MYVEEIKRSHKLKNYCSVLVRESYRQGNKVLHRTLANISKLPRTLINQIKYIVSGKSVHIEGDKPITTTSSREYGASAAIWKFAQSLHLDTYIHSKARSWRSDIMAMIVGRLVYQGSKLSLTNLFSDSALWELAGYAKGERVDVDLHCYQPLDQLLSRQKMIQKKLAEKHLKDGAIILYDITSSYLEGEYKDSAFGKNRDNKRGHEQIIIGLLTTSDGRPVAVEVYPGNTSDQTTVLDKVKMLTHEYGVKEVIFAGDRGMLTPKRIEEVTAQGYKTLTTLTHKAVVGLLEREVIQLDLFDEKNIAEVYNPDEPSIRYLLSKNPCTQAQETQTRRSLIAKTVENLEHIKNRKKRTETKKLSAQVGKALSKHKVGKFFKWDIIDGKLEYIVNNDLIEKEEALDGCYTVRTDVSSEILNKEEAVRGYRRLAKVEKAFRNLKTVSLEIRPIYHHYDYRIQSHVFLCMLAYYVQWHIQQKLEPLFDNDGKGKERRWTFHGVLKRLKSIRKEEAKIGDINISDIITTPDNEQKMILKLLNISL